MEAIIKTVIRTGFIVYLEQNIDNRMTVTDNNKTAKEIVKARFSAETGYISVTFLKKEKLSNKTRKNAVKIRI